MGEPQAQALTARIVYPVPANVTFSRYATSLVSTEPADAAAEPDSLTRRLLVRNSSAAAELVRLRGPRSAAFSLAHADGNELELDAAGLSVAFELAPGATLAFVVEFWPTRKSAHACAPFDDAVEVHTRRYAHAVPLLARAEREVEAAALVGRVDTEIPLLAAPWLTAAARRAADAEGARQRGAIAIKSAASLFTQLERAEEGLDGFRAELTAVEATADPDELAFYSVLISSDLRQKGAERAAASATARRRAADDDAPSGDGDARRAERAAAGLPAPSAAMALLPPPPPEPAAAQHSVSIVEMPRQRVRAVAQPAAVRPRASDGGSDDDGGGDDAGSWRSGRAGDDALGATRFDLDDDDELGAGGAAAAGGWGGGASRLRNLPADAELAFEIGREGVAGRDGDGAIGGSGARSPRAAPPPPRPTTPTAVAVSELSELLFYKQLISAGPPGLGAAAPGLDGDGGREPPRGSRAATAASEPSFGGGAVGELGAMVRTGARPPSAGSGRRGPSVSGGRLGASGGVTSAALEPLAAARAAPSAPPSAAVFLVNGVYVDARGRTVPPPRAELPQAQAQTQPHTRQPQPERRAEQSAPNSEPLAARAQRGVSVKAVRSAMPLMQPYAGLANQPTFTQAEMDANWDAV